MEKLGLFYGFRGNISFPDQMSIYNLNIKNDSTSKNEIFVEFFNALKEKRMISSQYQSRLYYLIFRNQYDNIIHCQLARRKKYNKHELADDGIIDSIDDDYPYINIFVELDSQKFLIESNTQTFENYNTCGDVIENIVNNYFKKYDIKIMLNPIVGEESFWEYFDSNTPVYNLEFSLCTPNLFDADDDATTFLKEAEKNTQANKVNMKFINSEGKIRPNKIGIDSFVKYATAGGGDWSMTIEGKNSSKQRISSKQKSTKINLPLTEEKLKSNSIAQEKITIIRSRFLSIETIEKFKEDFN